MNEMLVSFIYGSIIIYLHNMLNVKYLKTKQNVMSFLSSGSLFMSTWFLLGIKLTIMVSACIKVDLRA